ncbi:hypothetical protein FRB95_011741 [Tulasnella sp. JGI-2019a]|nr:hypothetical protein FRB95_011741 [Tulasnella sp. JGI-2019a]
MPLRDGIIDPELEQRLLGAEVSDIIDALSIGWYESILSTYLATKPVKVVSSMGEQSVGKSYSLNHLIDSSFAGSAVRTTEGVWLSICPTKDVLVVALDFEGVHSIERTAQEDMLLVLFNTALSNLVIFRNNYALSRDVANMFTSFQASTQILDPAANPKLFKGLLSVVIKDVVEGDKSEIAQEFQSKLGQIVDREQATNFMTKLHGGATNVIAWSVIESRQFYTMFSTLRRHLLDQPTTHESAGEFLITLKTLMAKLKAQDWGSMDQTIVKHRVTLLSSCMRTALETGFAEIEPMVEELRNLDNQKIISSEDSGGHFYLGKLPEERQATLKRLWESLGDEPARGDPGLLVQTIQNQVDARLRHVDDWIRSNTTRFAADSPDIQGLRRQYEELSENLKANSQVCLAVCASCRLPYLLVKSHDSSVHDCCTSHNCLAKCDYLIDHKGQNNERGEYCALQAGHEGHHLCKGKVHLCGHQCALSHRPGCQGGCTKAIDHQDSSHLCSTRIHECGEPCDLRSIILPQTYNCEALCTLPYDEVHDRHSCDDRRSCPFRCELCRRYCTIGDHFHGMNSTIHLCDQEHRCKYDCEYEGVCEVKTTATSIKTIFVGRHERFEYPKYTQIAKRLPCAVVIPPGARAHIGRHVHNTEEILHFCETACLNCGYICHLPLGHSQSDHDTAHGSMENTSWVIEGGADAFVEMQGRKFAALDGGAPQLCSLVCSNLGRHAHVDYCRNEDQDFCQDPESEHIDAKMHPQPDRPKDWVSHKAFWARTGFKDPYSQEERTEFAKCDAQCSGPEHEESHEGPTRPSFCTLPIFHPPHPDNWTTGTTSHISADGHLFPCPNPTVINPAFHVIFVLDKSGSMADDDRQPVPNTPSSALISRHNPNRFGAVLSALYGFWTSRETGIQGSRRDAYSVILFDEEANTLIDNDVSSTPAELLDAVVDVEPNDLTSFDNALLHTRSVMESRLSDDRYPVVIFLSDGECDLRRIS